MSTWIQLDETKVLPIYNRAASALVMGELQKVSTVQHVIGHYSMHWSLYPAIQHPIFSCFFQESLTTQQGNTTLDFSHLYEQSTVMRTRKQENYGNDHLPELRISRYKQYLEQKQQISSLCLGFPSSFASLLCRSVSEWNLTYHRTHTSSSVKV